MSTSTTSPRNIDRAEAARILREADDILIVSHMRPDGDCLGSTVGLVLALRALGKRVAAYNAGPLGDRWDWLQGIEHVRTTLPEQPPALTVFVDCGAAGRVGEGFRPLGSTLNIDHHLSNTRFADANWIDVEACAVGEQVFQLVEHFGVDLTPQIATAVFLSILTDTGGFRYSNTTARALSVASRLVEAGARPGEVSQAVYENKSRGELVLTGRVLARLQFECGGRLAWSELRAADYDGLSHDDEPDNLSSEIRGVKGVEISCLFNEILGEERGLRASLRGKGTIDCSAIAAEFGGGGHFNAAGLTIKNAPYDESRARVLRAIFERVSGSQSNGTH